jgi:outer membrane lipoprotein-sorting protein
VQIFMSRLKSDLRTRARTIVSVVIGTVIVVAVNACSRSRDVQKPAVNSQPTASATASPVREAITWNDIAKKYDEVHSYQCLYEKEEHAISNGEKQTIKLSFRKPFDVRLDWLNDSGKVDQTAVYRQGFNDGKVLARRSGLLGALAGTMRLNPTDSVALSDSRHPITEMGIGKIIERGRQDTGNDQITSHLSTGDPLDGRATYRFEFAARNSQPVGGLPEARKALIWVDRELKLPIKLELYDESNALLERHYFKDLRLDVKLPDTIFTL